MNEIVWIRPADLDPTIVVGSRLQPDTSLPTFEVVDRCRIVMMFSVGAGWEVKPFTQLKLKVAVIEDLP